MRTIEQKLVLAANRLDAKGDKLGAIKLYKKAGSKSVVALTNLATIFYELNDLKTSEKYCHKVLRLNDKIASVFINLGNIYYQKKDYNQAVFYYQNATLLKPDFELAYINLANTYLDLKDYGKAIFYAEKSVEYNPETAHMILGHSYLNTNNFDNAIFHFKKLNKNDPWSFNHLSHAYQKKGDWNNALKAGLKAVEQGNNDNSHHINFGYLLYEYALEKDVDSAKKYADIWKNISPKNNIVSYVFDSLNNKKINKADVSYVQNIFDVFSEDFDTVLKGLEYSVPEIIGKILEDISPKKGAVLDLGCGTGLCGEFLKKYASWRGLTGVDISSKMIDVARRKKLYTKFICDDMEAFLESKKNTYNLITAGDVFTYVGDLKNLFQNIHRALKKNGRIIFSVSENNVNKDGFFLSISGRFLHHKNYIKKLLKDKGFEVEIFAHHKLRNEGDKEVWGFVVCAKRIAITGH